MSSGHHQWDHVGKICLACDVGKICLACGATMFQVAKRPRPCPGAMLEPGSAAHIRVVDPSAPANARQVRDGLAPTGPPRSA